LPQRLIPHGSALNNTMRQVAASVGTAVLVTVMTGAALDPATHGAEGLTHGVNIAFIVAGAVAVVGFIRAFFIRGSRPVPQEKAASEAAEETTPEPREEKCPGSCKAAQNRGVPSSSGWSRLPDLNRLPALYEGCAVTA